MSDKTIPREQGATRRAGPSDFRAASDSWGGPRRSPPANTDQFREMRLRGLPPQAEPLPRTGARTFGRALGGAAARVGAEIEAGGLASQFARATPWGRVLTLAEILALGWFIYDELSPEYIGPGGDPVPVGYPSPGDMASHGWTTFNWPPPLNAGGYDEVYQFRKNVSSFISNHSNPNAAGGTVLPWGDWSSVGVGDGVYCIQAGPREPHEDWPLDKGFIVYGSGFKSEGDTDPWTFEPGGLAQPVRWGGLGITMMPMPNPNIMRNAPTAPDLDPTLDPELQKERATAREVSTDGAFEITPTFRQPPKEGTKERKYLSKNGKWMVGVFNALDQVSELSEIVDVFYKSIPKKERRAYERELGFHWAKTKDGKWHWMKPKRLERGLLDQAGQYGIDGADYKAEGLRRMWDKIDTEEAFKGLINNQAQDFTYGQIYKRTPKNLGHAADGSFEALNDWLRNFVYV